MLAAEQGRDPRSLKIIIMLTPIVAETDAAAQEKLALIKSRAQVDAALALWGGWTGIDLSGADPDKPLDQFQGDGIRAFSDMLTRVDSELVWTPRRLAEWLCVGGMSASCVGSPRTIVDHLEEWLDVADVDGFNIARVTNYGTFEDFRDLITPELRRRGLIRRIDPPVLRQPGSGSTVRAACATIIPARPSRLARPRRRLGAARARLRCAPHPATSAFWSRSRQSRRRRSSWKRGCMTCSNSPRMRRAR